MTIYIHPFVAGVLATLLVEFVALVIAATVQKNKKGDK